MGMLFFLLTTPLSAKTPYGNCLETAQYYQNRYENLGQVSDLVCFQHALQRELTGQSPISSGKTKENSNKTDIDQALSRIETYCFDHRKGAGSLSKCLEEQNRASNEISESFTEEKMSACTGYTTGMRSLGSMENIDQVPLAKCMKMKDPYPIFSDCVKKITNKQIKNGNRFWNRQEADNIASCFNAKIK